MVDASEHLKAAAASTIHSVGKEWLVKRWDTVSPTVFTKAVIASDAWGTNWSSKCRKHDFFAPSTHFGYFAW